MLVSLGPDAWGLDASQHGPLMRIPLCSALSLAWTCASTMAMLSTCSTWNRWMLRGRIVTISERELVTNVGWKAESTFRNSRWRRVKSEGDAARCGPELARRGR